MARSSKEWKSFSLEEPDAQVRVFRADATKQVSYRWRKPAGKKLEVQRRVVESYYPDYATLDSLISDLQEFQDKYVDARSYVEKQYYDYSSESYNEYQLVGYEPLDDEEAEEVYSRYQEIAGIAEAEREKAARERAQRDLERIRTQFPDLV